MAFTWFKPWAWFTSKERKESEEVKRRIEKLETRILTPHEELAEGKPYKNLYFSPPSLLTVVLPSGEVIMRSDSSNEEFVRIRDFAKTEEEIKQILTRIAPIPKEMLDKFDFSEDDEILSSEEALNIPKEAQDAYNNGLARLLKDKEFKYIDTEIYLLDIPLAIPPVIVGTFIEILEKMDAGLEDKETLEERYASLKLFWGWLSLNPIPAARRDALRFIIKNNITIDNNGLLIMYRRVVSLNNKTDVEFNNFVTSNYLKVKKNKKSPKNFFVTFENDEYKLTRKEDQENLGSLAELYDQIKDAESNIYTDNHTKTKEIRIGHVYREDEDAIDLDNKVACGQGLHVGASEFGFNGFGDTGVIALVNPMKIRSVPIYDSMKMRVSEMFIAGVYDLQEYKQDVLEGRVASYSSEYCSTSLEELNNAAKDKNLGTLAPKKVPLTVTVKEVRDVSKYLTSRVKKIG